MEVICFEDKAFFALIEKLYSRLKEQDTKPEEPKWISADKALELLDVTHKTTLLRLRNEGKIRFTQPKKKIILYDRDSINEYLEDNSTKPYRYAR